ncbi:effector-associated domain 2-containing protein [Streptomyces sp. NBC_01012]|uniref:effector-associated domain 2-containing protein n=1 Tax=Streptomyces sp. NBC_01012 TaxID=2903717 RepID=UPI003862FC20|nr:caspase family protein [Streptomyces sp. NBC_01012]
MTRRPVPPDRVRALVVGIEQYAAGTSWDLPGPARDALRFRDWLLARGVPDTHIQLHLAPLPGSVPDVPFRPADHESLRRAFIEDIPDRRNEALWVWWGGHGVLDPDDNTRLYTADATSRDRRNIHVESALARLRSDVTPGLGVQMWMVDACRTFDEMHGFPQPPPTEILPSGRRVAAHEQILMFAAGRGQRAGNDPQRRLGVFSDIVLSALPDELLPDPAPLFEAVKARMEALGAANPTGQLPDFRLERPGHADIRQSAPPPSAGQPLVRLIDALMAYPLMNDRDERQTLINELPSAAVARMPRHQTPRTDVIGIVRTLRKRPDGLWTLYGAVKLLDDDAERSAELEESVRNCVEDSRPGM